MVTRMDKRPLLNASFWRVFLFGAIGLKSKNGQKTDCENILPFYGVQ